MKTNLPSPAAESKWTEQPLEWPRASGLVDELLAAVAVRKKRRRQRAATVVAATVTGRHCVVVRSSDCAPAGRGGGCSDTFPRGGDHARTPDIGIVLHPRR